MPFARLIGDYVTTTTKTAFTIPSTRTRPIGGGGKPAFANRDSDLAGASGVFIVGTNWREAA